MNHYVWTTKLKITISFPSRRGLNGYGRCNHVGGVIFAIEDFSRNELQSNTEPVSCTSRLCGWNVPRNMKTDPKPVDKIVIQKIRYGKKTRAHAKSSDYDPRAPSDRQADGESIKILGEKLSSCLQSSIFLIAHNIKSCTAESECDIAIDSVSEAIPSNSIEIDELLDTREDVPFNDDYNISSKAFKSIIDCYIQAQEITDDEVKRIERETRGQSQNIAWMILKETVLTASNFKKAAKRTKEPDCLLRDIMYINDNNKTKKVIPSLQYGLEHEDDAVDSYVSLHQAADNANLKVTEVGTQISKETPGLGASLDRLVYDPSSKNGTLGGLEVKCPYSKRGQSIEQACSDKKFFMTIENGNPVLKREHAYFYQIQGQMYVCNLPWVDFVVWLGNEAVAVQRVLFDSEWWYKEAMPALLYFYKRAFLPEVFTRRVKRGIQLYRHGGWLNYKQYKKLRPS